MAKGRYYEERAREFLLGAGLEMLETNFHCKLGEIDIICSEGSQLVFVEVRYRASDRFGSAAASVDRRKQRRIISTARFYLRSRKQHRDRPCRFDVIAMSPGREPGELDVQWLKNAFLDYG